MFDGRFRTGVDRAVRPVGLALRRTGVSPDALTVAGAALAVPTAIAIGSGQLRLGLGLLVASALPDLLDGAVARASGRASARGAFLDSVFDRVTDGLVLAGLAWYLQDRYGGHIYMLPFAVLAVSLLISYERAKAESLGFHAKGGLMERAERIVLICAGLLFAPVLVPLLWVMLALSLVTVVQRFYKVWRQASPRPPATADAPVTASSSSSAPAARGATAPSAAGEPVASTSQPVASTSQPGSRSGERRDPMVPRRWVSPSVAWTTRRDRRLLRVSDEGSPLASRAGPRGPGGQSGQDIEPGLIAARWRAWREASGRPARASRFSDGTRRSSATARWYERRRARLEGDERDGVSRYGSTWRRSSSRRP